MFGGLQIEMNVLKMLGDWMQGSGWTSALGRADGILRASHVTRTTYIHQVTAASLHILTQSAHMQYKEVLPENMIITLSSNSGPLPWT